ncbi:type II toxin-antitoxin system RelE/ParE family toxin [Sphingomonas yabuuchiae]|uniref:type II toxin-antitoxin system RelE/ParE family toxin n=1 Tax=Sphingomonas yabuuchiae TaxID=172044 RepID=UPI003D985CC7
MTYDVELTSTFKAWLDGLTDQRGQRAIAIRLFRAEQGLLGVNRSLGNGISEMKIDVGPGYRLYYTIRGQTVLFMLHGGDKSTQKRDVKTARKLAEGIP